MTMFSAILLALSAQAAPAAATADIPEPNPSDMSKSEIREHNAKLTRTHRYYIRCVKAADTGSLVARKPVCRTNERWALLERAGSAQAREMADAAVSNSASNSGN
jgi:hypothetical protein